MSDGGVTRRDAARVIAAVPIAAAGMVGTASASSDQVVFGLIGTGAWGQRLLVRANGVPGGRCAGVCDPDEASRRRAATLSKDKPEAFSDYRELLARKDIQAVLIATPHYTHFPITRDALLAGKHVQCEPPLVFRLEEAAQLRELASKVDLIVQTSLERRYSRVYQTARQMAVKGFLGDVTNIQTQWHRVHDKALDATRPRERNWQYFREFSGGLAAELGSHQIDLASWVFNDQPEMVTGVGALDWRKDGRDVYDNEALIFRYSEGRQMTWSAISTSRHLPLLGGQRHEAGEVIIGTEGTIEIALGNEQEDRSAAALWFYEPARAKISTAEAAKEIARVSGATMATSPDGRSARGLPILLAEDQITGDESFVQRELKYMRRWLYAKGIMVPEEDKDAVTAELESFFECCREGKRPKAGLEAGLDSAVAVILANRAMDEGRRVAFSEVGS
jgi:predicted dehydrogenase